MDRNGRGGRKKGRRCRGQGLERVNSESAPSYRSSHSDNCTTCWSDSIAQLREAEKRALDSDLPPAFMNITDCFQAYIT